MAVNFSNKYPYTDMHEMNLDWIIKEVQYWSERVGKSIQKIEKTGTSGLVDIYTITYSDESTSTFDVTNGNGIVSIAKTGTAGLVDTYTITFTNGSTMTFDVTNGTAAVVQTPGNNASVVMSQKASTNISGFHNSVTHENIHILTGDKFQIGTFSNPSETRRIRLAANISCPSGALAIKVPSGNTYGYEIEIMSGGTVIAAALNAWSFTDHEFKLSYSGVPYVEFNIYMKKSDNSDWSTSDIDDVLLIAEVGGLESKGNILNIMSHNVGHYNYGVYGGYTGADYLDKVEEWKQMYGETMPDIILLQEWNSPDGRFDANGNVNAKTALYDPLFAGFYTNHYATYGVGTIISKFPINSTWDIEIDDGGRRDMAAAAINVNGEIIVLVSIHLKPGTDPQDENDRESQRDALIAALSGFDKVIIGGDFNTSDTSFYDEFITDGYTICNHGYFGDIETFPSQSIDNIIVKGFLPYNASADASNACTSDHYPLISKIRSI